MASHLEEKLQQDIDRIRDKVREMADLALRGLEDSVKALTTGDTKLAYTAILRDSRVDDLESMVDSMCVEFIVRHIPVATHLRFVHSVAKIVSVLERVGDYAESINRQAILLSHVQKGFDFAEYEQLAAVAVEMTRQAVRSFLDGDLSLARRTIELDAQANRIHQQIYKKLEAEIPVGSDDLSRLFSLLSVANRYERVADQAVNICEEVFYMLTGEIVKHRSKGDARILFVSSGSSCLAQLAEAVGSTLGGSQFSFASATTGPGSADPDVVEFMARRGVNVAGQIPMTLDSIGNLEHYRVVVAVDREAARAMSSRTFGFRTVVLEWDLEDPSRGLGVEETKAKAYGALFDELLERTTVLIQSLHGTVSALGALHKKEGS